MGCAAPKGSCERQRLRQECNRGAVEEEALAAAPSGLAVVVAAAVAGIDDAGVVDAAAAVGIVVDAVDAAAGFGRQRTRWS